MSNNNSVNYSNVGNALQFDASENRIANINILEAFKTNKDVYLNESYTVVGEIFEANKVYASYNLTVIGDISANSLIVNGDLFVTGKIIVNKIQCKRIVCNDSIKADIIEVDGNIIANSVICKEIYSGGNVIVNSAMDINDTCEVTNTLLACEGVTGDGTYDVNNTVVGEYFEFNGDLTGNIFEISTMFNVHSVEREIEDKNLEGKLNIYSTLFHEILKEIIVKEENEILDDLNRCSSLKELTFGDLKSILEEIIRISYLHRIDNYRDYLIAIYANYKFPDELKKYETIEHVFSYFIPEAKIRLKDLEYKANNLREFAFSLKVIIICHEIEELDIDEAADKVFSSVGIRFSTVKRQL